MMHGKRAVVTLLAGLNIVLAVALAAQGIGLPNARAQGRSTGRAGDFVCVTAKASGQAFDVLFALDLATRKLHAFYPPATKPRTVAHVPPRDLKADFEVK